MPAPPPRRPRIMRRKTVSVTPAMGANTVAGEIFTSRIEREAGSMYRRPFEAHAKQVEPSHVFLQERFVEALSCRFCGRCAGRVNVPAGPSSSLRVNDRPLAR